MKPNVQLNHIIGLAMDLGAAGRLATVNIGANSCSVLVLLEEDRMAAKLDDRDGMNKIADWLSLAAGGTSWASDTNEKFTVGDNGVLTYEAVGDIAEAKAEATQAIKQEVDKPRFPARGLIDVTAPSVLSS